MNIPRKDQKIRINLFKAVTHSDDTATQHRFNNGVFLLGGET
jgi:hypothetical protein